MADTKISALTGAATLAGTEELPVVQGGATVKTTPAAVKTFVETGGTVTADDPILDLSQTWNNAAVTFTGVKVNVTNTASAAPSKVAAFQVGGVNKIAVASTGSLHAYDLFTDDSNYARLALNTNLTGDWVQVAAETAGTGGDNYGIALTPTGTGAISAHVPDSGVGGGNARGANAVDWQTTRSAGTQVASGAQATIGGGTLNTASGTASTVAGGLASTASGTQATVGGGSANQATGVYATVSGGIQNLASGNVSAVLGGSTNTASAASSVVVGGEYNVASGILSWVPGGTYATTRGLIGAGAYSAGRRSATGDRQTMLLPISCAARTDATATVMTSDAGAASTTNQMVLPNNSSMFFEVDVVAHDTTLKSASWKVQGTIRRGANAAATAIVGTNVTTAFGSDLSGGSPGVTCTADTTNGALAVTFTGIAATTIYPSGHIRAVIAA